MVLLPFNLQFHSINSLNLIITLQAYQLIILLRYTQIEIAKSSRYTQVNGRIVWKFIHLVFNVKLLAS